MTYLEMKDKIKTMTFKTKAEFEESLEYAHFKTVFRLKNEPEYTVMQCKDEEEFNTSSEVWLLCIPKDGQMCVIDAGTEDEICEQFMLLLQIFARGFGTVGFQKKDEKDKKHK